MILSYTLNQLKKKMISINDFSLSSFGIFKTEKLEELRNAKNNDLQDSVYRIQLAYEETIHILDLIYSIPKKGYTLQPVIFEMSDLNKTLEYLLPDNVTVSFTTDDIRLGSNLKKNQTLIFT